MFLRVSLVPTGFCFSFFCTVTNVDNNIVQDCLEKLNQLEVDVLNTFQ